MPDEDTPTRSMFVVTLAVVLLSVADFIRIDATSHSASDTLLNWIPQTIVLVIVGAVVVRLVRQVRRGG
jgi:choline-glycine betaine transporter